MRFYLAFLSVWACACAQEYTDLDLSIDMATFMKDTVTLKRFNDCFLDKAPCDDVAAHYKGHIAEALADGCKNCSAKLKHNIHTYHEALRADFPEDYAALRDKYDPTGELFSTIEAIVHPY